MSEVIGTFNVKVCVFLHELETFHDMSFWFLVCMFAWYICIGRDENCLELYFVLKLSVWREGSSQALFIRFQGTHKL